METLKQFKLNELEEYDFFDVMDALGVDREDDTATVILLWESWINELIEQNEHFITLDKESRDVLVRYMKELGTEITEQSLVTLCFSAFTAGIDLALKIANATAGDDKNILN